MIPLPTGQTVLNYLGWPSDDALVVQATKHAQQAAVLAKSYVRGRGFGTGVDAGKCEEDLAAVIISSAARSLSNPSSAREIEAGTFKEAPGSFYGWSLVELLVLQGHRRMCG